MDVVLLGARLILAGIFLVAGIGKLADLAGSRQAVESFGVPKRFASMAGLALPIGEIVLAVALIPVATAWWGALGSLLLLLAFIAAIAYNIAHGRTPDCHCFGQIHSEPAGPRTLVRNGILAVLAATIVAFGLGDPGLSAIAWIGDLTGPELATVLIGTLALVAIVVIGALLSQLILQNGRLLIRIEALEETIISGKPAPSSEPSPIRPGMPAPSFNLPNLDGVPVSLDALRALGRPTLLVFSDPNCHACSTLLPNLAGWQAAGRLIVAVISRGTPAANRAKLEGHSVSNVLLQADREIALAYGANVTPAAIIVRPDGIIESALARGVEEIKTLVASKTPPPPMAMPPRAPVMVGMPAPALSFPDLDGNIVSLDQFRGSETMVLFWNPECGYCQRLLPEMHAWEANPPADAPRLLVVSQGSVDANRNLNFRAPVLIANGRANAPFGIPGTPSAVMIDAEGRIASPNAKGMNGVLGLLHPVTSMS